MDHNLNLAACIYGLQMDENDECITDVPAYRVFKFDRGSPTVAVATVVLISWEVSTEKKTFEEICKEVKRVIDGIPNTDETVQKQVVKRWYLAWHPDKQPDETKELATEVFKYIQQLIKESKESGGSNFSSCTVLLENRYLFGEHINI